MKFTVVYKYTDEVKQYFEKVKGTGYGDGVKLVRLDAIEIIDRKTGAHKEDVYLFRCKSSLIHYLMHKDYYGRYASHRLGWR